MEQPTPSSVSKTSERGMNWCNYFLFFKCFSFFVRVGAVVKNVSLLKVKTMDFQDQVKFVRMHLQLSQEELARQMGISFATISRWEREKRKPQLALLGKFYSFC